jgi:hypothetical protein
MRLSRLGTALVFATATAGAATLVAQGKPIAGCPHGGDWDLVTVASLGIDPETASGIPSLDGNADGYTCTRIQQLGIPPGGFYGETFRDNNVR